VLTYTIEHYITFLSSSWCLCSKKEDKFMVGLQKAFICAFSLLGIFSWTKHARHEKC